MDAAESFKIFYRSSKGKWAEVDCEIPSPQVNVLQTVPFQPIESDTFRLYVIDKPEKTSGLLEWIIE